MKLVAAMLRAIHAQEDRQAAIAKSKDVIARLQEMKLMAAAKKVEDSIVETLEYMYFPREHWRKIRSNNVIERLNREIKRRTRVVGTFPDGESALMLVCARLRYMESSLWGSKMYMSMKHLEKQELETQLEYEGA
jgi:transposase-like protein